VPAKAETEGVASSLCAMRTTDRYEDRDAAPLRRRSSQAETRHDVGPNRLSRVTHSRYERSVLLEKGYPRQRIAPQHQLTLNLTSGTFGPFYCAGVIFPPSKRGLLT
jgi:hypothetical protein